MEKGQNSTWSIGDILKWTSDYFQQKGVDSPRLTAELLLSKVLGISRLDLYLAFDKPLNNEERATYRALVKRRALREPLAYITGEKAFWTLDLKVSPSVLIPRPDTELMIELVIDAVKKEFGHDRELLFADLGTGSGAIALSILSEIKKSSAVAVDISFGALEIAFSNAVSNKLDGRVGFINANWFDVFSKCFVFDFIVSNPPYIKNSVISGLEPEVKLHEPISALDGGEDGLDCVRCIVSVAPLFLKDGGFMAIEIGFDQGEEVRELIISDGRFTDVRILKDYGGNDRIAYAKKKIT